MGTDWASGAGGYSPAIMAAIATLIGGHFLLKGKNRQLAYAAGIGMAIPAGAAKIGESVSGLIAAKNGNGKDFYKLYKTDQEKAFDYLRNDVRLVKNCWEKIGW